MFCSGYLPQKWLTDKSSALSATFCALLLTLFALSASAQSGRAPRPSGDGSILLNVTARRAEGANAPVNIKQVSLYDNAVEQSILSFTNDPSPARIVLLVDSSLSLRADSEKLAAAVKEFAYEIYDEDQLLVVGYNEQAEILADWTDDAKKIEAAAATITKKGQPFLFDGLRAAIGDGLEPFVGLRKRAIVLITDGLDRGSKAKFDDVLVELQRQDITVYALQLPDRTGGALRRDQPKPPQVIQRLTEGTGGAALTLDDPQAAAKTICDELRNNRYLLAYTPLSIVYGETRNLLVLADEGINIRAKQKQPPL